MKEAEIIKPKQFFKYTKWQGINPITGEMEIYEGHPSIEQKHWSQFKEVNSLKDYDFTLEITKWDFPHWEEYQRNLIYRVMWTDGDDSRYEIFVTSETEARNIVHILSDAKSTEEMFQLIQLCELKAF